MTIAAERGIAQSFWGRAWCDNIESYAELRNRLERGRSYARSGAVLHLAIGKGSVEAHVLGSHVYDVQVKIRQASKARWDDVCRRCAGEIGSVVDLLQGRLSKSVMAHMCDRESGLFPAPAEISFDCSCPDDWTNMCKHVAAVLYGIGARLDEKPQLLFQLRGVDENELIARAGSEITIGASRSGSAKRLVGADLGALFELDLANVGKKRMSKATRTRKTRPR
ncbi:MAG TPA: hypothetical protein VHP37_25695 [Burkholderiales bacterium]|nr:hypothetical protein [Burkholderiales bacterium]